MKSFDEFRIDYVHQIWGQFHIKLINSNCINSVILPTKFTPSTCWECLLWVVYVPSRILMEEKTFELENKMLN